MTLPQNTQKILVAFASLLIGISIGLYIPQLLPKRMVDSVAITQAPVPKQKTDARITLKRAEIGPGDFKKYGLPDPCDFSEDNYEEIKKLKFDAPPTDVVYYKNLEKGIKNLMIPYNPEWGGERFRIEPYEGIDNDDIVFGTMLYNGEGCGGYYESQFLSFFPPQSPAAIIAEKEAGAKKMQEADEIAGIKITTHTLRNKQIVEYSYAAMCGGGEVVVIGKKYNYGFSHLCYPSFADDAKMIETMEFSD